MTAIQRANEIWDRKVARGQVVFATGTSEGVRKGWESRKRADGEAYQIRQHRSFHWGASADFHGVEEDSPAVELHHGKYSKGRDKRGTLHNFGESSFHTSEKRAVEHIDWLKQQHKNLTPEL